MGARFANRSEEVEDLEAQCFVSLAERARDVWMPWSSVTFLIRSYNAPKAWYGVGRPFAIGACVSLLLVVCRRQYFTAVVLCEPGARGGRTGCVAERATCLLYTSPSPRDGT